MIPNVYQRSLHYAFVSLLAIPVSVLATTLPWQGPYVGIYLGGAFGNSETYTSAGSVTNTSYFATSTDINAVNNAGTWTKEPAAVIVGIAAGHDWVWNQMVYGIALDYGSMSLNSSNAMTNSYPDNSAQYSVDTSMQTNWLLTLRGRLGYQTALKLPALLYMTGGMAMTQLKVSNHFNDNSSLVGAGSNSTHQDQIGWTVGTGIEIAAFHHGSVDIEYLYVDVPSVSTISTIYNTQGGFGISEQSFGSPFATTVNFSANLVRVALNYRFDE